MIHIEFSESDITALEYERYHHPHPHVQRKMEVLYLKSQGLSHQDIRRLCRIKSKTTLVTSNSKFKIDSLNLAQHPV